jgi:methylmalonyl-CoA/ethylmalonyl-CoA epimerase
VLVLNLDHIAVAVEDLDEAVARFGRLFGVEPASREVVADQGVEKAMIPVGGSQVQLLCPLETDTPVGRFLERRGEGLHHIAFAVPDIVAALVHLEAEGVELIDREPRAGGGGRRVAFVRPGAFASTLIELVEIE